MRPKVKTADVCWRVCGIKLGWLHGACSPKRNIFMKFCYGTWLHLIMIIKKSLFISHTAAHNHPNKMFHYEPSALITQHTSPRTRARLCEKENHSLPLNPIKTWMCFMKINQGHRYSSHRDLACLQITYSVCEITVPPPLTEFAIILINVSFQNERQKCQIAAVIHSFNSLICIK